MTAQYLAGCDGGSSTVRAQLGIALQGETLLTMRQPLLRCEDLYGRNHMSKGRQYHVADDKSTMLIVQDDAEHFTLHAVAGDEAEMPELFRRTVAMPLDFETLYVGTWTQRLMVADNYCRGRVFLAGDSGPGHPDGRTRDEHRRR